MEKIICQMCGKEKYASEDFPEWCERCAESYDEYNDDRASLVKMLRKRGIKYES
ncbi:hypothetical protein M3_0191 [Lysinibacillus phage vB_LfM_LysYB1]|nr:hypothetical protein M3_0191 [Lysinibacillus phage vB_LfM_LysYB1]WAB25297.1 hypothetical protein M5_0119 [Lysinibacillus phage vB_LfM_LysYB2]